MIRCGHWCRYDEYAAETHERVFFSSSANAIILKTFEGRTLKHISKYIYIYIYINACVCQYYTGKIPFYILFFEIVVVPAVSSAVISRTISLRVYNTRRRHHHRSNIHERARSEIKTGWKNGIYTTHTNVYVQWARTTIVRKIGLSFIYIL